MNNHSFVARTKKPMVKDKRRAILDAALALFSDQGFHATTMPQIAARAGVAAGTPYLYFKDKEALGNALYQDLKTRLIETVHAGLDPAAPSRKAFLALWERLGALGRMHPEILLFLNLHHHEPYLNDSSRALEDKLMTPLWSFIRNGQAAGVIKALPPAMINGMVFGAHMGLLRASRRGDETALAPERYTSCGESLWLAIKAK